MKPKIIFLNTHPVNYFTDLYRYLTKESKKINLEVWFSSFYGVGDYYDKQFGKTRNIPLEILNGFNYKVLSNSRKDSRSMFYFDFEIFKRLRQNHKLLIICHGWQNLTLIFVLLFGKMFGHKVGLRMEQPIDQELNKSKFKLFVRGIFFTILNKQVEYFFFIGTKNKKLYEYYGIKKNKLYFLPYATAPAQIKPILNTQKLEKNILFCGKLIKKKNPMDLLKAFHKANIPNTKLSFVGDGNLKKALLSYVKENRLNSKVQFFGLLPKNEVYKKYKEADLFILPSGDGETWGLVVNEALGFGLPIILSKTVGSSIDLCNGNGYIFDEGNISELSEKLENFFLLNEKEVLEMKKNSLRLVNKFSFNKISTVLDDLQI